MYLHNAVLNDTLNDAVGGDGRVGILNLNIDIAFLGQCIRVRAVEVGLGRGVAMCHEIDVVLLGQDFLGDTVGRSNDDLVDILI